MTLREPLIIPLLLGLTIYLLLVDIFVTPVLNERCIQETGRTCAEAVNGEER